MSTGFWFHHVNSPTVCVCIYLSFFSWKSRKKSQKIHGSWLRFLYTLVLAVILSHSVYIYIYTLLHSHKAINIPFWIPYIIPFCMLLYTELDYLWISSVCELTAIIPAIWLSYPLLICIMIRYILYI